MAPLILYSSPKSPPCQLVLLIAKHLNLELECKARSNEGPEYEEFLKINPSHTIPTLVDNGFNLTESRAIAIYLLEKYGKNDPLVPTDPKSRALMNQRLFFDLSVLYHRVMDAGRPLYLNGEIPSHEKFKSLEEGFGFLNEFLKGNKWLIGDRISVADYAVLISVSFAEAIPLFVLNKFPNVVAWFEQAKKAVTGYDEIVAANMKSLQKQLMEKFLDSKSKQSS